MTRKSTQKFESEEITMKNVIEIKKDIEKMERSIFSLENQLESGDVTYEWKKMNDELKDLKTRVELLKKEVAVA